MHNYINEYKRCEDMVKHLKHKRNALTKIISNADATAVVLKKTIPDYLYKYYVDDDVQAKQHADLCISRLNDLTVLWQVHPILLRQIDQEIFRHQGRMKVLEPQVWEEIECAHFWAEEYDDAMAELTEADNDSIDGIADRINNIIDNVDDLLYDKAIDALTKKYDELNVDKTEAQNVE